MLRNKVYYGIKPLLPLGVRRGVRRWFALRKRGQVASIWPRFPGSEKPPAGWRGWPGGKKFALILTHDVEGKDGVAKCRPLAALEKARHFRSSFNFIPEGDYDVPKSLRDELTAAGFEVGVHDLHHDGKLYRNWEGFVQCAAGINRYLSEWGAVGFRSGFMHHNLSWLHELKISYDCSTFDTDPFEPQPDSVHTIFPFWVQGPNGSGYVELPYTLPQDSTLFLILREKAISIWREKLDWIAEHGGMALVNTHPDYMNFSDRRTPAREYSSAFYDELLEYATTKYAGQFWHATPREVADYIKAERPALGMGFDPAANDAIDRTIWIDLDNTPHVPLFAPVVHELSKRGYKVVLTARDAFQVCDLAAKKKLHYLKIGRHYGKNKIRKLAGLFFRAAQLAPVALRERPVVGLSHGSRSQILICNLFRIPTILMGFGLPDDGLHSPNEKYKLANYYSGIMTIAHFFEQYGR